MLIDVDTDLLLKHIDKRIKAALKLKLKAEYASARAVSANAKMDELQDLKKVIMRGTLNNKVISSVPPVHY